MEGERVARTDESVFQPQQTRTATGETPTEESPTETGNVTENTPRQRNDKVKDQETSEWAGSVASTITEQTLAATVQGTPIQPKMAPTPVHFTLKAAGERNYKKETGQRLKNKRVGRTYDAFLKVVVHSEKWRRHPHFWEQKMKESFKSGGKIGGKADEVSRRKKEFVLQFAGPDFQEQYDFDYWLYAWMDKRGTQVVFPPWLNPPKENLLTLKMLKEKTYNHGVDPFDGFPKEIKLFEPKSAPALHPTAGENPDAEMEMDGGTAMDTGTVSEVVGNTEVKSESKEGATLASSARRGLATRYIFGDKNKTKSQRRKLRQKFWAEGDTTYKILRECISVDPSLPAPFGFQITNIPTRLFVALVKGIGSLEYSETYEKCADLIYLTIDEQPIMQLVMGDVVPNAEKPELTPTSSVALAMDRLAQVTGEARLLLETSIMDHVSGYEEKMSQEPFSSDFFPKTEGEYNKLTPEMVEKWTSIAMTVREKTGWPGSFTEIGEVADGGENESDTGRQQLELNLRRAKDLQKDEEMSNSNLFDFYQQTLGFVPMWERTLHGTYLMHSWGMDPATIKKEITLKQLADTNRSAGTSSYLDIDIGGKESLGNVHDEIQDIIHRCIIIVMGGNPDNKEELWEYVASSGIVRTGREALPLFQDGSKNWVKTQNTGQEIHVDSKKMVGMELMRKVADSRPGTRDEFVTEELERWGWAGDLCLSEVGRPYKTTRFDAESKQLKVQVGWTPCGTINVRHMVWPHAGHGGACGSTLFHTTIVPKKTANLFDGDHLGYIRLLGVGSMRKTHKHMFDDWKVVWDPRHKENSDVTKWESNVDPYEKTRGTNYSRVAWKGLEENEEAMTARWLCSPSSREAFDAMCKAKSGSGSVQQNMEEAAGEPTVEVVDMDANDVPVQEVRAGTTRPKRKTKKAKNPSKIATKAKKKKGSVGKKNTTKKVVIHWSEDGKADGDPQTEETGLGVGLDDTGEKMSLEEVVREMGLRLPEAANYPSDDDASQMSNDVENYMEGDVGDNGEVLQQQVQVREGRSGEDNETNMADI